MRETRTMERIKEHYELEKKLANRLRNSTREERKALYPSLYTELFEKIPDHPQLTRKYDIDTQSKDIWSQMRLLHPFLDEDTTFLEIGPGDCLLSFEVAKHVKKVYTVDVTDELIRNVPHPTNFEIIISDGSSIDIQPGTIDVTYSNQLMEHLHPDDAIQQLSNIYNALAPSGVYICGTPHRFSGPHDVSMYFDKVATGFHLKEYTNSELSRLFRQVGFSKIETIWGGRGHYLRLPLFPSVFIEALVKSLPFGMRRAICRTLPFAVILGIRLIAWKSKKV